MTHVSPNHTSFEWQASQTKIAVLPIGAFEQHGHHLPLDTDTVRAKHCAEFAAESLNAALLPAIPYGTSLEHKGFRGSISLSPDALTGIVQSIVNELESQSFNRLIIINGHGGNFSLFPCIRSINRADRPIKIIAASPGAFYTKNYEQNEVHAGENETSVMLAIGAPVGDDRRDHDCCDDGFIQSDLNTFGFGRMNRDGVWGFPTKATQDKGKVLINESYARMIDFIKQRLEWLEEEPAYGGTD